MYISRDVLFDESNFSSTQSSLPCSTVLHHLPASTMPSIPLISSLHSAPSTTPVCPAPSAGSVSTDTLFPVACTLQDSPQSSSADAATPSNTFSSTSSTTRYCLPSPSVPSATTVTSTPSSISTSNPPQPSQQPASNTHVMNTRSKAGIFKPKAYLAISEPKSVTAALAVP